MVLKIDTVAIIGAGERGRLFALRCAEHGCFTLLQDVLPSRLRAVEAQLSNKPDAVREHLKLVNSIEDAVREADVAIDFVPDELESKLEIFSLLDRMAPPKTILCTPTKLSISDLAACTYRADRCVAVAVTPEAGMTAELIRGTAVSEATLEAVQSWLSLLGFDVHVAQDAVAA